MNHSSDFLMFLIIPEQDPPSSIADNNEKKKIVSAQRCMCVRRLRAEVAMTLLYYKPEMIRSNRFITYTRI
jgi:hypothetical protein